MQFSEKEYLIDFKFHTLAVKMKISKSLGRDYLIIDHLYGFENLNYSHINYITFCSKYQIFGVFISVSQSVSQSSRCLSTDFIDLVDPNLNN